MSEETDFIVKDLRRVGANKAADLIQSQVARIEMMEAALRDLERDSLAEDFNEHWERSIRARNLIAMLAP